MARGEYTIKNLYQPKYSPFNSKENSSTHFLGKEGLVKASQLGISTNPTVANQIGELSKMLNTGVIPVEIGTLDMKNFDSIPKEHWDEIRRKADLNKARVTLHAPLIDPSGFNEQQRWDASQQKLAERQLMQVMEKAINLTSKNNPIPVPVTIHTGNMPGSTYGMREDPNTKKREKVTDTLIVIDRSNGQLAPITPEESYSLSTGKFGEKQSAERMLEAANQTQWRKEIDKIIYEKENADRLLDKFYPTFKDVYNEIIVGGVNPNKLPEEYKETFNKLTIASSHLHDAQLSLDSAFEKAYKYGDEKTKEKLTKLSEDFRKEAGYVEKSSFEKLSEDKKREIIIKQNDLQNQARLIQETSYILKELNPKLFQRVEDFAIDKASETLANVALNTYEEANKRKIIAPQLSLENLYQGLGLSQSEDLKNMIEKTRNNFQSKLMEKKISSTQAKKIAEEMIGATFDVGHLNLSRKHGFNEEDMKKEAEAIANYVNKVHLTDNFGNVDSHLPLGMGNVPVEILLKALGEKGKNAVKINEIGGYTMNYGKVAFNETLEAFGSPLYSSGVGPYWSESTGFQQSYSGGMGSALPQVNYETFGAGFSSIPQELGGSRSSNGVGGRMGGGRE